MRICYQDAEVICSISWIRKRKNGFFVSKTFFYMFETTVSQKQIWMTFEGMAKLSAELTLQSLTGFSFDYLCRAADNCE